MAVTLLVTYDISDDDVRAHVSARLQAYGHRVQRSVFLIQVDADKAVELIGALGARINEHTDSLLVLRQCEACFAAMQIHGVEKLVEPEPYWVVL